MVPINDEWLMTRLTSGSKRRLYDFRVKLARDEDRRNYDKDLARLFEEYLRPNYRDEYFRTKEYLRKLRSSEDGKLFSQGVKSYAKLELGIAEFQKPDHSDFRWNRNYQSAKKELIDEFSTYHLKMVHYSDDESIIRTLPKTSTHCGYTYLFSGKRRKGDNMEDIYARYQLEEEQARINKSFNKPILPGVRTQNSNAGGAFNEDGTFTGDCKHKTRLVAMIDMMQIIAELRFAKPLQSRLASEKFYAGGKDMEGISSIIANMRIEYPWFISLDYQAYDQSISSWLLYDVFEVISHAYDDLDEELYWILANDFIHKNFIMADGVYHVDKGVASGSMYTQIWDTVVNRLIILTMLKAMKTSGRMIIMGDDNLLYLRDYIPIDQVASYISKNFGITVNATKSGWGPSTKDPEFLSCVWRSDGRYREYHVVIAKLLYPERFRDYERSQTTPSMVLFSYIMTYPISMWRIMDTDKFRSDHPNLTKRLVEDLVDSRYIPGALTFIREYTLAA